MSVPKPCNNIGFSGNTGYVFTGENAIPNGVFVGLSGYAQTAAHITVTMKDSNGTQVAQITGTGTGGVSMGLQTFTADGGDYTLTLTSNNPKNRAIEAKDSLSAGVTTYATTWAFIMEDSPVHGDCDFNDATVYVTWNLLSG